MNLYQVVFARKAKWKFPLFIIAFFIYKGHKGSSAIVTNIADVSYFFSLLRVSLSWLCFRSDLLYLCIFPEAHSSVLFFNSVSGFPVSSENY